jgi:hypothetical protein
MNPNLAVQLLGTSLAAICASLAYHFHNASRVYRSRDPRRTVYLRLLALIGAASAVAGSMAVRDGQYTTLAWGLRLVALGFMVVIPLPCRFQSLRTPKGRQIRRWLLIAAAAGILLRA